jgi:hypothetical protein
MGPAASALAANIQTDLFVYQNGDTVTVTADGFGATETVDVVTTDPYGTVVDQGAPPTDDLGNVTYQFVLNSDVPGIYDVVATGRTSGLSASTQFDPAILSVTPTSKNFGSVTVGSTGTSQTFTIKNTGTSMLNVQSVTLGGTDPSQFTLNTSGMLTSVPAGGQTAFSANFAPTSAGAKSATIDLKTNDTNPSLPISGMGTADTTPPVITRTITGTAGSTGWYVTNVTVAWSVTDPDSAVTIDSGCGTQNFTTETTGTTSSCTAHSTGGSSTDSVTIKIDKTAPTASLSVTGGTLGLNGWYVTDVTVQASGTDTISTPVVCTADQLQTTETAGHTFNGSCTNNAGLTTNASALTIKLDETPPQIDVAFAPAKNVDGWNNTASVAVSYACSDNLSGIDASYNTPPYVSGCPNSDTATSQGITTFNGRTTRDLAGNTTAVNPSVNIDRDAPIINQGTIHGTVGNSGWYKSDVTVDFSAFDSLSGLKDPADASFSLTASGEGSAVSTGSRDVFDKADNSSTAGPLSYKIDKHAPTIACGSANSSWHGANVSIACTASDLVSGLANPSDANFSLSTNVLGGTYDANASTGTHQVCDAAGNCATAGPISGNKIDLQAPTFSCDATDTDWHGANVDLGCTAQDGGSGLDGSSPASFTLSTTVAAGQENLNASTGSQALADAVGNSTTAGPYSGIKVDRKAPTFTCDGTDTDWHGANVDLGCTAQDGGSGLDGSSPASFTLSTTVAAGQENLNASTGSQALADAVGNSTTAGPYSGIKVDRKAPSFSCDGTDSNWHGANVALHCTAQDGGSGLNGSSPASFDLSTTVAAGQENLNASTGSQALTDAVGNSTTAGPYSGIKVDRKAPTFTCDGTDTDWHGGNLTFTCTAADGGSGVAGSSTASLSTTVADGDETATAFTGTHDFFDVVGNSAQAGPIGPNMIDRKAPLVSCGSSDGLWHANDVMIHCTATDGGSGIPDPADQSFDLSTNLSANTEEANVSTGTHSVADAVGNTSIAGPVTGNQIDKKAPAVSCGSPDGDWHATDVSIGCDANDGGSGLLNAGDASFSLSTNVPVNTDDSNASTGSRTVKDNVLNATVAGPIAGNKVDKKKPVITCASPDADWHGSDVMIQCAATDGTGSGLAVPGDASFYLSTSVPANTETANASTGTHQVCDAVNNCEMAGPISGIMVDKKTPQQSSCDTADGNWHGADVTLHCTYTDGGSGPASQQVALSTNVAGGTEMANAIASAGTNKACDAVGNCAASPADIGGNKIDKKAPQQTACDSPSASWSAVDVTLHCTYTDGGSGPASQQVALSTNVAGGTETANAIASAGGAQACDASNNCADSPADIAGNKIDRKAPAVACAPADGLWHPSDVGRLCAATDGGSGVAGAATFTLNTSVAPGDETDNAMTDTHPFYDVVGNSAQAGPLGGNKVDKKSPTFSCDPTDSAWHGANVTRHCTAQDGGSGLNGSSPASFDLSTTVAAGQENPNAPTGSQALADAVGNSVTAGPYSGIKVDRKAPVISCGSADGLWHATDVSIACTATDGGSGLASPADASFSLSTAVPAGTETTNASTDTRSVADGVANAATAGPVSGNKIDKKGPSITITTPGSGASYTFGQAVAASYGCTDGGSGLGPCNGTVINGSNIDTASVGTKTFTVTAADAVLNASTLTSTYYVKYAASGMCNGDAGHVIRQPINADGTSVFKQGSTVPAKFRVCDANGVSIGTAGVVSGFRLIQTINGTIVSNIDEAVDSTTPDSDFRWDPTDKQWIFNMSTKKLGANKTYIYVITLNDGSTIQFQFGLK